MENISYIGLATQNALKQQLDITANNIANVSTPGFKAQGALFMEYMTPAQKGESPDDKTSMVWNYGSFRRTEQGSMQITHNDLDLALEGNGYFAVETKEGIKYTRAGNFSLNTNGEIVTPSGNKLLGDGDRPITIPKGTAHIKISGDGSISGDKGSIGKLRLVEFEKEQDMVQQGDNLYDAVDQAALPATNLVVKQGAIEGSNVQPVVEMNRMIDILRTYQSMQNILQNDHDRIRSTIQKLTRV